MKQYTLIFLFLLCGIRALQAQVFPPEFICVKNDTLKWNLPANTCGPFISYQVWASPNKSGPYTLLASIADPFAKLYYHNNAGTGLWYYFLRSNYNCPGQQVINSDTLDNRPPEPPLIERVSVENGRVRIDWQPSPSPETRGYIIYRSTTSGTLPIDTVFNATTFADTGARPGNRSEIYYLLAMDGCGNTSIFGLSHQTVFLRAVSQRCSQSIGLSWNPYRSWPAGVERQEVWVGINGRSPVPVDTLGAADTAYVYRNVTDGYAYCFEIRTVRRGDGLLTVSNQACLTASIVKPVRQLLLKNLSVTTDNKVEVSWLWDNKADVKSVAIQRALRPSGFVTVAGLTPTPPLKRDNTYTDLTPPLDSGRIFYRLRTADQCDSLVVSNYGATIHLEGFPQANLTNLIRWTPFEISGVTPLRYKVYRILDGTPAEAAVYDTATLSHTDVVDASDNAYGRVCYYVVGEGSIRFANGSVETVTSRSNTVCVGQASALFVPNAFSPRGRNQEFRPIVRFSANVEYYMAIYNRWGEKLFETTALDIGWDGKKEGRDMEQGVYAYVIRIREADGRVTEDKGTLFLLR